MHLLVLAMKEQNKIKKKVEKSQSFGEYIYKDPK